MALSAVNLGIFLSMFARTEFQAVQFIPLVIVPQVLLVRNPLPRFDRTAGTPVRVRTCCP